MDNLNQDSAYLKAYLQKVGYDPSDRQLEQFNIFHSLLCEWNEFMNLTGITEYKEVVLKHFVDSLAINCAYPIEKDSHVVDMGTGAGFPGIPLKIMYPDCDFTLIDSLNKRIKFLDKVIEDTSLSGIVAVHARAEEAAKNKEYREKFDVCVSRAVANLSTLSEYCLPFVKNGGVFVSYKAGGIDDELLSASNALKILGGEVETVKELVLPDSDISRTFVVIRKVKATPNKYPRKAGLPSKEPL